MKYPECVFHCEDLARWPHIAYFRSRRQMNLMTENPQKMPPGIIGYSLEFGPMQLPVLPKPFLAMMKPTMAVCEGEDAFDANFLSKVKPHHGLFGWIHGHPNKEGTSQFRLRLRRKPVSAPPEAIVSESKQMGGYPTGFNRAIKALGAPSVTTKATLSLFVTQPKLWPLNIARRRALDGAAPFSIKEEKITLAHGGAEIEIDWTGPMQAFGINVSAEVSLPLDGKCFERGCELLWQIIQPIFKNDVSLAKT